MMLSNWLETLRNHLASRFNRAQGSKKRRRVHLRSQTESLEDRTLLAAVVPVPPGTTAIADFILDNLPDDVDEVRDQIPTQVDEFIENQTTLAYVAFPQEVNNVEVTANALNFFLFVDETNDNVPLLRALPAFTDDLIEDIEAGFSFIGEVTFPVGDLLGLDLPDVDAISPNPQAIASFFPIFQGIADGIDSFLDRQILPEITIPEITFPRIALPEIDLGFTTICEGGCTIIPEFTLLQETPLVEPLSVRDILDPETVEVLEGISEFFAAQDDITGGGVFVATLDGNDTVDLSNLTGVGNVVFGGPGADVITGGGGDNPLKALGVSTFDDNPQPDIKLFGEGGRDTFVFNPLFDVDNYFIDGGPGNDRFLINGSDGNDIFRLVAGPDGTLQKVVLEAPNPNPGVPNNEVQQITLPDNTIGGTFTLSFRGETTVPIDFDADGADIDAALEALSSIGAGNVNVTGPSEGPWEVEFTGSFAQTDVLAIATDGSQLVLDNQIPSIRQIRAADLNVGTNKVQRIALPAETTGGTFTLVFDPDATDGDPNDQMTTNPISAGAGPRGIRDALVAAGVSVGDIAVDGDFGGPWDVEFTGNFRASNAPALTLGLSNLTGGVDATVNQTQAAQSRMLRVTLPNPTSNNSSLGGTFTLTFEDGSVSRTTAPLPANATAADIQSALESLDNIEVGDVTVSGNPGGPWDVTLTGLPSDGTLTANAAELTGGVVLAVGETDGSGSNEIQRFTISGGSSPSDTFTITFDNGTISRTTDPLPFDVTEAELQTALENLASIGGRENVIVRQLGTQSWEVEFTGEFAATNVPFLNFDISSLPAGSTLTITEFQPALPGNNEVQVLDFAPSATGGDFTLSFEGETTGPLSFDASAAQVQTALENLASIETGDITVTGANGGPWTVEFVGRRAATDVETITGDVSNLTGGFAATDVAINQTQAGIDEQQEISLDPFPVGGTFTLTFNGERTDPIAHNAGASGVEEALEALARVGTDNVSVTGSGTTGDPFVVTFQGELASLPQPEILVDPDDLIAGLDPQITLEQEAAGTNEVQRVTLPRGTFGGTFRLTFDGETTADIDFDATTAEVQSALEALSNIDPGDVDVTGTPGEVYDVEFTGSFAETDQPLMAADGSDLNVEGGSLDLEELTRGTDGGNIVLATTTVQEMVNVEQVQVVGGPGDDQLIIDNSNGPIHFPLGINFDGGDGTDRIVIQGDSTNPAESSVFLTGPGEATGSSLITFGPDANDAQTVNFENLDPVLDAIIDLVPADSVQLVATGASNAIDLGASQFGGTATTSISVDSQASFQFANKDALRIDALGGDDAVTIDVDALRPEIGSVEVNGDGSTEGDSMLLLGTAGGDEFDYTPTGVASADIDLTGSRDIDFTLDGVESFRINARGNDENATETDSLTVNGTDSDDTIVHTPGTETDAGSVQVNSLLEVFYRNFGPSGFITLDALQGSDISVVSGTIADDILMLSSTGAVVLESRAGRHAEVRNRNTETLRLASLEGDDVINVSPAALGPTIRVEGGGPSGSDLLTVPGVAGVDEDFVVSPLPPFGSGNVSETGSGLDIDYTGIERVLIAANAADDDSLEVDGTAIDETVIYRPSGESAGRFRLDESNTLFDFTDLSGPFSVAGGSALGDQVTVEGTNNHDVITVDSPGRTITVENAAGINLKPVVLADDVEVATVRARLGNDTILVVPAEGVGSVPLGNLVVDVDGGPPSASDALIVAADTSGTPLDNDTHFVVVNRSRTENEGVVRLFRDTPGIGNLPTQLPDIVYSAVEVVEPLLDVTDAAAGEPNLLILGPDRFEPNEFRNTAAFVGSGETLNLTDLAIFPNVDEHPFVPADQDWFRFVAAETGTLDFQVFFEQFDPELLPAGGDITVEVYDADGDLIGTSSTGDANERIAIPVVRNETYDLRVVGADDLVANGYDMTVINVPVPVPQLVDLQAGTDSGRNDTDDVTNAETATFDILLDDDRLEEFQSLELVPGVDFFVDVFNNGELIGTATFQGPDPGNPAEGSRWEFTASVGDLIEGHNNFLSAAVRIRSGATSFVEGRGGLSDPLQVTLDPIAPPASFGLEGVDGDGLLSDGDRAKAGSPEMLTGNGTNPTFWGRAEADSTVRIFLDLNRDGLVDDGDLFLGQDTAIPTDGNEAEPDGYWEITSVVGLNDQQVIDALGLDGLRQILVTAEDLAGNVNEPGDGIGDGDDVLELFLDTQGPRIADPDGIGPRQAIEIGGAPGYNLFAPILGQGPTPPITSLIVNIEDAPDRVADFLIDALDEGIASNVGHYLLVGDRSGIISIDDVIVTNLPPVAGDSARATIELRFNTPLPDDRYSLTIRDDIVDPACNKLDGESNFSSPAGNFLVRTGDGVPGGDFFGRFTVDSRPEIASVGQGVVQADINGNFVFDPSTGDFVNRDQTYGFGLPTDAVFAGELTPQGVPSDGFDRIGAYGFVAGAYRWLLDFNNDGIADSSANSILQINGLPFAGEFVAGQTGDEVGLFDGTTWFIDTNGDNNIGPTDLRLPGNMRGLPITGDFDGDGLTDLATHQASTNTFFFDLTGANDGTPGVLDGHTDAQIDFGFGGVLERPFAGDFNLDGVTDIGLTVPNRNDLDARVSDWYILSSNSAAHTPGTFNALSNGFFPVPGEDVFTQFGSNDAVPLVGNFRAPAPQFANVRPGAGVVGADAGGGPHVRVFDNQTGEERLGFFAYDPRFSGGVRVASGDVNGDGIADVITGPGAGGGPHVRVFDGHDGSELMGFMAFDPGFTGGVTVAGGDINMDGLADVIVGAGAGGGPHVRVFSGADGTELMSFFAFDPGFTGGVTVAGGDINRDGLADVIVGAGAGGGPHVRAFSGADGSELMSFFAFAPGFTGGVNVGAGDINGDGFADVIVGAGAGGGPHVRAFSGADGTELLSFFAFDAGFTGGVRVAAGDVGLDGQLDILATTGPGTSPIVRVISGSGMERGNVSAFGSAFTAGAFVAGGSMPGQTLLLAGESETENGDPATLSDAELASIVQAANSRLDRSGSLPAFRITDLPGRQLGQYLGNTILIDAAAAGRGWFVDDTPEADEEFDSIGNATDPQAQDRVDLLTVVLHELGHRMGLPDLFAEADEDKLMAGTLLPGQRRLPRRDHVNDLDGVFANDDSLFESLDAESAV